MNGVVAVVSGKGGVGKSITASSLIQTLTTLGYRVGALDCDYSNPNLGRFLRVEDLDISVTDDKKLIPAKTEDGINFFSIEKVVQDRGVSMEGDQYARLTKDVIEAGIWDVDYMVIDLPASISSEFKMILSAYDKSYLGSFIIVQPAHSATAERVIKTHLLNGVPILGVIENMSEFKCWECNTEYNLFGPPVGKELCEKYKLPFLGEVPFDLTVQAQIESGTRVKLSDQEQLMTRMCDIIASVKPQELGFIADMKRRFQGGLLDTIFNVFTAQTIPLINKFVNIKELQNKHNYHAGMTVSLEIFDQKTWDSRKVDVDVKPNKVINYRVENGKMVMVKTPKHANIVLRTTDWTLVYVAMGKIKFPDGHEVPYSIKDAVANGDIEGQGIGSNIYAMKFLGDLWDDGYRIIAPKIQPLLAPLVM